MELLWLVVGLYINKIYIRVSDYFVYLYVALDRTTIFEYIGT